MTMSCGAMKSTAALSIIRDQAKGFVFQTAPDIQQGYLLQNCQTKDLPIRYQSLLEQVHLLLTPLSSYTSEVALCRSLQLARHTVRICTDHHLYLGGQRVL